MIRAVLASSTRTFPVGRRRNEPAPTYPGRSQPVGRVSISRNQSKPILARLIDGSGFC